MEFGKYNLINTPELIGAVDQYLMNEDGTPKFPLAAYDLETNGLYLYRTAVVGFSFSVNKNQGFYVPLLVWVPDQKSKKSRTKDKVTRDVFSDGHLLNIWTGKIHHEFVKPQDVDYPDWVGPIIQRWFGQSKVYMWNAPFDVNHTFINFGVDLKNQLLLDGGLLAHIKNENESVGLKESAIIYREQLGINPFVQNNQEKAELKESIICNGGGGREVWRADLPYQSKYACADTFLTYGVVEVILEELVKEHGNGFEGDGGIGNWIFFDEVMPVCKEVVIDMKRKGVYIDVTHFKKLAIENSKKLLELEDDFIKSVTPFLGGFEKGKSIDEAVSHQRLVKTIIEMEGLKIPTVLDKKTGQEKPSIAKNVIKKEYEKNPHWIWGYILNEDEIKYSAQKLIDIKQKLYEEIEGRRYRFNLSSGQHLSWLFFEKLKENPREFPKTDSGTEQNWIPSLDAENIKELLLDKYPWVISLLKYKKIQKIQSTYVQPALELQIDGWMYMDMKQNGTSSGRFSCSGGYNLQTLPRVDDELEALEECDKCGTKAKSGLLEIEETMEVMANRKCNHCGHIEYDIVRPSAIKKGFIAPPGYKIINADYSSLEPRCFAYISEEEKIKKVYSDGLDLYSKVYIDMFDERGEYSAHPDDSNFLKKVNKKARTFIKPIVLGIPYGAGESQVANLAGYFKKFRDKETGLEREVPDQDKGKELRLKYLQTYPQLTKYMLTKELESISQGFVAAKYGRRRHFEYAQTIAELLYEKIPWFHEFQMSSQFQYVKELVHNFEQDGTLTEDNLRYCQMLETCYNFMYLSKKSCLEPNINAKNRDSGYPITLTRDDLKELSKRLKMRFSVEEPGEQETVIEKGCWSYIRNLLKGDLNNAKNHPIQALAGHITNMGMLETTRLFKQHNIDGWVCNQVHDEITCYAKIDQAEEAKTLLQSGMENNIFTRPLELEVKMVAEPIICDNLKDSK